MFAVGLSYIAFIMLRYAGLEETQAGIKIAGRNVNNLRYANDTTLMAESEEELKSFWMSLANGLSILFILSKNQLLALLIFAMVSFVSFAFISALIFKDIFPSTNPGVLHFFLF